MSVASVTARISEIQGQIAMLSPAPPPPTTSGDDFASTLATSLARTSGVTGAGATGAVTVPAGSTASESAVVAGAQKYLGIPYVWGGTDPSKGLDCSGLVQRVYGDLGISLPRVSYQQAASGTEVTGGLANARPGDLLAFNSPVNHIAIYIGDGKMIHAPRPGQKVEVSDVYATPTHIRRVLPADPAALAAPAGTVPTLPTLPTAPAVPTVPTLPAVPATSAVPTGGTDPATAALARIGMPITSLPSVPTGAALSTGLPTGGSTLAPAGQVGAAVPYANLFNAAGAKYGVSPTLLAAIAQQESSFNPAAVSPAGAQGLMQLMPGTAAGLGVTNSFDPNQAVDGGARMMRDLLGRFGSTELALAAYNAGPGAVLRYNGVPPYAETQNYVSKIMTSLQQGGVA